MSKLGSSSCSSNKFPSVPVALVLPGVDLINWKGCRLNRWLRNESRELKREKTAEGCNRGGRDEGVWAEYSQLALLRMRPTRQRTKPSSGIVFSRRGTRLAEMSRRRFNRFQTHTINFFRSSYAAHVAHGLLEIAISACPWQFNPIIWSSRLAMITERN